MEEFTVALKARKPAMDAGIDSVPVSIEKLATAANAKTKVRDDLDDEEPEQTCFTGDTNIIIVNENHREERQRFTVLHKIVHIVLALPSRLHDEEITTSDLISY